MPRTLLDARLAAAVVVIFFVGLVLGVGSARGPSGSPGPSGGRPNAAGATAARGTGAPTTASPVAPTQGATPATDVAVLVGAGDIADCSSGGDEATAGLLDGIDGTVFTLGDNAYERGTLDEFRQCYGPSWGRHAARTMPVPGNHEYETRGATGYYGYFGAAAGDPAKGYYADDRGAWRIYVLNSNCDAVDGCEEGSAQERWLRRDLADNPRACVLAMWHHPLFSSSEHGNDPRTRDLWRTLYEAGAELVLNGHDHEYERFAPQTPAGREDPDRGIVEFVVGTGGRSHYDYRTIRDNSLARDNSTYGVLRLDLAVDGWSFEFIPVPGGAFSDSGTGSCH